MQERLMQDEIAQKSANGGRGLEHLVIHPSAPLSAEAPLHLGSSGTLVCLFPSLGAGT